jgi:hypothetical protein
MIFKNNQVRWFKFGLIEISLFMIDKVNCFFEN